MGWVTVEGGHVATHVKGRAKDGREVVGEVWENVRKMLGKVLGWEEAKGGDTG